MDPEHKERMEGCHPDLITKVTAILFAMKLEGCAPMFVVEGLRTADRQHTLYMKGRTPSKPYEKIVTNCDGYKILSNHQAHVSDGLGHAVDLAFQPIPDRKDPFDNAWPWDAFGTLVRAHGLTWGGDFPHLVDRPHVELPDQPKC